LKTPPVSHEGLILRKLRAALTDMPAVQYASGMGSANRFPLQGWNLVGQQQFQFGDLRIETPTTTIVVEAESAGGVTNLAKYWPYVEGRPAKPCPAGRRLSPRVPGSQSGAGQWWKRQRRATRSSRPGDPFRRSCSASQPQVAGLEDGRPARKQVARLDLRSLTLG